MHKTGSHTGTSLNVASVVGAGAATVITHEDRIMHKTGTRTIPATLGDDNGARSGPQYAYQSTYDRQGYRGSALYWTMGVLYTGLGSLALLLCSFYTGGPSMPRRPKAPLGLPPGYTES